MAAGRDRRSAARLGSEGKCVLLLAADFVFTGQPFGGQTHVLVTKAVDEAVAEERVDERGVAEFQPRASPLQHVGSV